MLNAQLNSYYTTDSNVKKRIDDTDPNNIYIGTIKNKYSINQTGEPIWDIVCIKKVGGETLIGLRPNGVETWNNIWDNRTSYTYN